MLERALTPASVAIRALNQRADVNPMVKRFRGHDGGEGEGAANVCIRGVQAAVERAGRESGTEKG